MTRTLRNDTDKTRVTTPFAYAPIPPAAKATGPSGLIGGAAASAWLGLARTLGPARRAPEPDADTDDCAAEANDPLRAPHLVMDAHPAQQIGRVGAAGGKEPAAGIATTPRCRREQPADQCVAVAHRPQQKSRRRRRLVGVAPEPVRTE